MYTETTLKNTFPKKLLSIGDQTPGSSLVLLLCAVLAFLQILSNYLIKYTSLSAGIVINELFFIAGLPILVVFLLKFDLSKLFPHAPPGKKYLAPTIILAVSVALLIDYAASFSELIFPLPEQYRQFLKYLMSFKGPAEFIFKLFLLCIIPGLCEEIFFRGFCQSSLEIKWGWKKAVIATAVFFAALHGNLWYIHLYFLLGLFLGWIYKMSGTLWIPIACHITNNALTFILYSMDIELPIKGFTSLIDISIINVSLILSILLIVKIRKLGSIPHI